MESDFVMKKFEEFQEKMQLRSRIKIAMDPKYQACLDIMEYIILMKFEKKNAKILCNKNNKMCEKQFKRAFKQLSDLERLYHYILHITFLDDIINQNLEPPIKPEQSIVVQAMIKLNSSIRWKQSTVKLDFSKNYVYIGKQARIRAYDLNFYIQRKSKTTEFNSLVLQGISSIIDDRYCQVYIGIKDVKTFRQLYDGIKKVTEFSTWQRIKKAVFPTQILGFLEEKHQKKDLKVCSENNIEFTSQKDITRINDRNYTAGNMVQSTIANTIINAAEIQEEKENIQNHLAKSDIKKTTYNESDSMSQSLSSLELKSQTSQCLSEGYVQATMENQNEDENYFKSFGELVGDDIDEGMYQANLFQKLMPDYNLDKMSSLQGYTVGYMGQNSKIRIFSNESTSNYKNVKAFMEVSISKQTFNFLNIQAFVNYLATPETCKLLNSEIEEITIKAMLASDNSAVLYQKNKPYNRFYRSRDFVFVRHLFKRNEKYYIVDKSVQDSNIPPFTTIVRGATAIVYEIHHVKKSNQIAITIDATIQNYGYLKEFQEMGINIKYFKGFEQMQQRIAHLQKMPVSSFLKPDWSRHSCIHHHSQQTISSTNNDQNIQRDSHKKFVKTKSQKSNEKQTKQQQFQAANFKQIHCCHSSNNDSENSDVQPYANQKPEQVERKQQQLQEMQMAGQISMIEKPANRKLQRKFDSQQKVIVEYDCLKVRHSVLPLVKKEFKFMEKQNGVHPVWEGDWRFNKEGGFTFINQKKIQDQKNVLKFIFSQVARNIVHGKSILNISLPVDIFSCESNLQRFVYSMTFAPCLLEPVVSETPLKRFLQSVIFGMTNSTMYLDMQKPFNPILGQTFQCYINGCPAYAEQISHHPPVAAILLIGRGYKVSSQIESKMKLNINSGTGLNQGVYRIKFDESQEQVCYVCPGGQVSGLAYGERKFNLIGKAYGWCEKNGMFVQIVFNPNKRGFFEKAETPIDSIQGQVYKVRSQFLQQFCSKKYSLTPKKTDILESFGKFHGNWNKTMKFREQILFDYDQDKPLELQNEPYPLPSDSNWREDISYRRILQISKAQVWKQKLQIQQRTQKKLRQKYNIQTKDK